MKLSPGLLALILFLSSLIGAMFLFRYYAYIIYIILGLVLYLFIKSSGRHVAFLFMTPVLIVSLTLTGPLFFLDFYDNSGVNPINLHPLIISWLVAFCLKCGEDLLTRTLVVDRVVITSLLVLVCFMGITFLYKGMSGIALAVHNYVGPITFFLFIYFERKTILPKVQSIITFLIGVSVLIGIFGILEYVLQANFLEALYKQGGSAWYDASSREGYRIKTIIGHPLSNALYFLFAMILVQLRVSSMKLKYGLMLLFMIDILLTGSRSMFIFAFLVILYNANTLKGQGLKMRQQFVRVFLIGAVLAVTYMTPLGSTFLNRVNGADSSTEARFILWHYFLQHLTSLQMMGLGGATDSVVILGTDNNPIILENPWIILFIDVGYFTLIYIALLAFILMKTNHKALMLVFIIAISGFNSFGVKSNVNYYLFFLFAYGYLLRRMNPPLHHREVPR